MNNNLSVDRHNADTVEYNCVQNSVRYVPNDAS
jgi:hypothetical protein